MSILWPPRAVERSGNSNDQTRQHNLSVVLTALHHHGVQSRAELVQQLGLNRSTIADLVGELTELGLASETPRTDQGTRGRPGFDVHPNDRVAVIAVNPDVDAVIIGLVGLGGTIHRRIRYETTGVPTVRDTVKIVKAVIDGMRGELDAEFRVIGIGIAVPGLVDATTGTVTLAPHLGWQNEPLADLLSAAVGYPAVAVNDAKVGLLAESIYGAGRGVSDLIYLNGSASGIGGGVLVGGRALQGTQGYGAELGHIRAHGGRGILCHCGRTGCLETEMRLENLVALMGRSTLDADEFDRLLVESTDPVLRAEIARQLDVVAAAVTDLVSVFNPEVIVLGGFLGSLHAAQPGRLELGVRAAAFGELAKVVRVERAQLRSRLLVVGAAEVAFEPLLASPSSAALA